MCPHVTSKKIQSRLVMHFSGYEPLSANDHYQRMLRECARFRDLWNVDQEIGPLEQVDDVEQVTIRSKGEDWAVSTRIVYLEWASFVDRPHSGTFWRSIAACLPAYLAHFRTLVPFRYFAANWRYGLYFIYPILVILLSVLLAIAAAGLVQWLLGGLPALVSVVLMVALFAGIFRVLGARWTMPMVLDVMRFTYLLALRKDPVAEDRLASFVCVMEKEFADPNADEILITFHSQGGVFAVSSLAEALRKDPDLLQGKKLTIMGIGSNLLKLALMSECDWLRRDVELVLGHANIQWVEIFANNDPLCFNKSGPDTVVKIPLVNSVTSRRVRISRMIDSARYARIKTKFFRLHRQVLLANQRPYFYDYYLIACGPRSVLASLNRDVVDET